MTEIFWKICCCFGFEFFVKKLEVDAFKKNAVVDFL